MADAYDLTNMGRTRWVMAAEVDKILKKLELAKVERTTATKHVQVVLQRVYEQFLEVAQMSIAKLSFLDAAAAVSRQYIRKQLIYYYVARLRDPKTQGEIQSVLGAFRQWLLNEAPWPAIMEMQIPHGTIRQKVEGLNTYFPMCKFI